MQKNGVTERSTIYWRGEQYGRIKDSMRSTEECNVERRVCKNTIILHMTEEDRKDHRVHTEWQCPLSDVHSIMIINMLIAQSGEGGGCTPSPFTLCINTSKGMCASA